MIGAVPQGPQSTVSTSGSIIEAVNTSRSIDIAGKARQLVADISLTLQPRQIVAIVGPSGCGKTTFLNMVAGLEAVDRGKLLVLGEPPRIGRADVGYLFARDALLPWRTVIGNIELPMELRGVPSDERRAAAITALTSVGLIGAAKSFRAHLSQGMRQRVALARTLVTRPSLLLLDEPFAALDVQTRLTMQEVLLSLLNTYEGSVLLVTHDLGEAIVLSDRVLLLSKAPATVVEEVKIEIPRPRSALQLQADPTFHALYERLWKVLGHEILSDQVTEASDRTT